MEFLIATGNEGLAYQSEQIQNISITTESSIRQHWSIGYTINREEASCIWMYYDIDANINSITKAIFLATRKIISLNFKDVSIIFYINQSP